MQRDAEHTGEAENMWGPLGLDKSETCATFRKVARNSRGNPPFNGQAIKWENLERTYGAYAGILLVSKFSMGHFYL